MRVALLQCNAWVGGIEENFLDLEKKIRAHAKQAELFVTPELALVGYPARDLFSLANFLPRERAALEKLQALSAELRIGILVGHTEARQAFQGKPLHNAATLFADGQCLGTVRKHRIPAYDIFEEERFFAGWPGGFQSPLDFRGKKIFVRICEDAWSSVKAFGERDVRSYPPVKSPEDYDFEVNLSASPYCVGKRATREDLFCAIATRSRKPLLYVNAVGGQDDILFDGASFALNAQGELVQRAKCFAEDVLLVDTAQMTTAENSPAPNFWEDLRAALVMGLRDFARKTGQKKFLLGLSGGVDSALVAALAAEALGPENVLGVSLPSALTSQTSRDLAQSLAQNLGISFREISIAESVRVQKSALGLGDTGLPVENLQARNRGLFLMALANLEGYLLLSTANKSETAMGYATLYGDMCGGLSPIADLYKTEVYGLSALYNLSREIIPWATLSRAPTAELAPGQKDSDSLPSYEILDPVVQDIVENQGESRLKEAGWNTLLGGKVTFATLREKIFAMEFKRKQAAPLLRVHARAFGGHWRVPIAKGKI